MKYLTLLALLLGSCKSVKPLLHDDGKLTFQILQINDVYEIAPVNNGKEGGVARIATLKRQLKAQNPNTFLWIAGDFLSPSIFNSLSFNGQPVRGKQMVEALNAAQCDLAVFGNHEFDIRASELRDRINESDFGYISGNAFELKGPFLQRGTPIPQYKILNLSDADGTKARVGIIGVVLSSNRSPYVRYEDAKEQAVRTYNLIKDSVDAVVALTHQELAADIDLAKTIPLAAIIGGHEHDQHLEWVGKTPVSKAFSNARSAYHISITVEPASHTARTEVEHIAVDEKVELDSTTSMKINAWMDIAYDTYRAIGFHPDSLVLRSGPDLDARENIVRQTRTNFTDIILGSMLKAVPEADIAIFNSGSIRVDDILKVPVSQYDVIRSMPFGGGVRVFQAKGEFVTRILEAGRLNRGAGGFLHYNKAPAEPNKLYTVVINDYLLTGLEANMAFLRADAREIENLQPIPPGSDKRSDIRLLVVDYLQTYYK